MNPRIDLRELQIRENEQVEWKDQVADVDDVVATITAFANDLANLGGGYVVCGAREGKDEHGFPRVEMVELDADRLREVEGKVLQRCRDQVDPGLSPLVEVLPGADPSRRVLVFLVPRSDRAHTFRRRDQAGHFYVRQSGHTVQARNGLLRELLMQKGDLLPWDRRPCVGATVQDLDLVVLRDALQRMGLFDSTRGLDHYLSDQARLTPLAAPLCAREPLTQELRPRNFAVLLFGREPQRFFPGAYSLFSLYPGTDRSEAHAYRHELAGSFLEQARRLIELLSEQIYTAFDKHSADSPNLLKYPQRALHEAAINALAHRDYELVDPTRVTVFANRIELLSPGPLPVGVDPVEFREGRSAPRWRNQSLAYFLNRLQLAQAEGQGIPTILRAMRDVGCPPPTFEANEARVTCVLPAHPRVVELEALRRAGS